MLAHRVGFLRRFGLKAGIHVAHFGLETGMVFEGTTGVYEPRIPRFTPPPPPPRVLDLQEWKSMKGYKP